jgi:hypothetical protein
MELNNMSKPLIRIHNISTGQITDREMTDAEFAIYEAEQAAEATRQAEAEAKAAARQAILDRLGLTEEEARLLLG